MKVKTNSKLVKKGDIFVAIKGHTVDGHDYIDEAIKNGAKKVVVSKNIKQNIPHIKVKDTLKWLNDYLKKYYSKKLNKLNIIGITGTNGKTTTAYITNEILNNLNSKTAYIGTIGYYINNQKIKDLENTTPDILNLYELLINAQKEKCENVILEVSSHSLILNRLYGLKLKIAGFTNLTPEHLDFHKTMNNYLNAKMKIIDYLVGPICINADDESYNKWYKKYSNIISYGKNGEFKLQNYQTSIKESLINFIFKNNSYSVLIPLKGEFNVYNYLLAISIISLLGFQINDIVKASKNIEAPKGRLQKVAIKNRNIYIDFAHTPDAMLKVLKIFDKLKKGKLYVIIGCGGNRDKFKRPQMGYIATNYSDYAYFTSDNPRNESIKNIINDMITNIKNSNYEINYDRKKTIQKALSKLKKDDVLLILGKGHEEYQIINNHKIPFSDYEEVQNYYKLTN